MTKRNLIVFALGALSLFGAVVDASAQPRWGRERQPRIGACFYEDINFRGRYFCVQPGEDLRSMPPGMGDRISSIRLISVPEVTVFRDSDMRGRSSRFTRDVRDLRRDGWNDQISSIALPGRDDRYGRDRDDRYGDRGRDDRGRDERGRDDVLGNWRSDRAPIWGREALPREGACFYEDSEFRGRYFCVPRGATYVSLPGGFNDRISSIRVFGAGVRIYQDRDFRGRSTDVRGDVRNLRGSWRDTISSLRVY
jgi:peptidase inhibitor family I36